MLNINQSLNNRLSNYSSVLLHLYELIFIPHVRIAYDVDAKKLGDQLNRRASRRRLRRLIIGSYNIDIWADVSIFGRMRMIVLYTEFNSIVANR